jgi:predicted NBD/HSP70 family sugar kinase
MNIFDIKQQNRKNVYFYLREKGSATKQDIAYHLQLSLPTVTQNLARLVDQGLISCHSKLTNRGGGRNPVAYSYVPDAKVAIGVDITRQHLKCIIVDLDGTIIKYVYRRKTYQRTDDYMRLLGLEVERIIESAHLDPGKIIGVGIAVPGVIDPARECVVDGRVIDNTGMTRADFSKHIPYRTKLIHDSDAAGFSEIIRSPNLHNACYISLGHSIGGSVFIQDKAYRGDGLFSCEFGHLNLIPNGRKCYCGQRGCFDPYCNEEVLSKHTKGDLFTFFESLDNGDEAVAKAWDTYLEHLSTAITEIRMMFGSSIIIGGDIGAFIDKHMAAIQGKVDAKSPFGEKSANYLFPCQNKMEAIATGAALYFVQEFLDTALDVQDQTEHDTSYQYLSVSEDHGEYQTGR